MPSSPQYDRDAPPLSKRDHDVAVIDLRDEEDYRRRRPVGAVRLTVEDIRERAYLLPPRARALILVGGTDAQARDALGALNTAERRVTHYSGEIWRDRLPEETGPPSRTHLWEPADTVVRALRYRGSLTGHRALDLACGSGRNAVYLALHGFDVTAVDVRADALERVRDLASRHGVSIRTLERDLEAEDALRGLSADLIVVVRFLERRLFPPIAAALNPNGILAYETFTVAQAVRGHPRQTRFMLERGELQGAFPTLETLEYDEGEFGAADLARLIAKRFPS